MLLYMTKPFTYILLFLCSMPIFAIEDDKTYLEPQEVSDAEWNKINGKVRVYNGCLNQEMVKWVGQGTDPRAVSDQVLELCSFHLIELEKDMGEQNINPEFTKRFIYTNKNRAAKKMLGTIMMLMSQSKEIQKATAETPTTSEEKEPDTTIEVAPRPKVTVIKQN